MILGILLVAFILATIVLAITRKMTGFGQALRSAGVLMIMFGMLVESSPNPRDHTAGAILILCGMGEILFAWGPVERWVTYVRVGLLLPILWLFAHWYL